MRRSRRTLTRLGAVAGLLGVLGTALWWRKHPSACPYSQRFWVDAPHPFITRARLHEALVPRKGERMLEVGPGTGYYTLEVAEALGSEGSLEIFDLQQEMLDHTQRRARERGLENVTAQQGDARALPYDDESFDAAYLVCVLGEVPGQEQALTELRRVLKPNGRVVVGELFGDPHWVSPGALAKRGQATGLSVDRRVGGRLAAFTVLRRSDA